MSATRAAELAAAYADCRAIARREAKNFYYGFLALPRNKSDAMCAMYAFMRRADDIADDESLPVPERRERLNTWQQSFRTGSDVAPQDRPVFLAVRDVQQRVGVSDTLLDELVAGTAMDLAEQVPAGVIRVPWQGRTLDVYTTLAALEEYCYLVASVVGLTTVRIFSYTAGSDAAAADERAVAMGKAFQLTNILRDVKEDAGRGRIYLPLEVLEQHGTGVGDVMRAAAGETPSAALLAALHQLAGRAEEWYGVERALIADLQHDSRGAMRTLVAIYHALLRRIRRADFQVFGSRISVPTLQKVGILLRGLLARFVS